MKYVIFTFLRNLTSLSRRCYTDTNHSLETFTVTKINVGIVQVLMSYLLPGPQGYVRRAFC
jgi:hypothetical protein